MRQRNVKNKEQILEDSNYYIKDPYLYKNRWQELFDNKNPIQIEIGMGKGKFIREKAIRNPHINFIGIERSDSILAIAVKNIDLDLSNLKVMNLDAINIDDVFDKEISVIYLNFSDPWPKKRHEKRRLTSYIFLDKYDKICHGNPNVIMKTDNSELFSYSIKSFNNNNYYIEEITFDLHNSDIDINDNITTEYEEKFIKKNNRIYMLNVVKKKI